MVTVTPSSFKGAELFLIRNKNGTEMTLTNYGATITSLKMPDKNGKLTEIVLGYDEVEPYTEDANYFGCIAGRYANRIAKGKFTLNGVEYQLSINDGENTLHGGKEGYSKKLFKAQPLEDQVIFELDSPDGDQGFPGNLNVKVTYALTDDNSVVITYDAISDKDTIVSLTNHAYFNLNGCTSDILNNVVQINADRITVADADLIMTGEIVPVDGTPYDLRKPTELSKYIPNPLAGGYDINYMLNGSDCANVYSPDTGIKMYVKTDLPGMQFYTAGNLSVKTAGHDNITYKPFYGLCLETQNIPDAINNPSFPSGELKAGEKFHSVTEYKFEVE